MPTILYREVSNAQATEIDVRELSQIFGREIKYVENAFNPGKVPKPQKQKEDRFILVKTSDPAVGFTVVANEPIKAGTRLFYYPGERCEMDRYPLSHALTFDKEKNTCLNGYLYGGFGAWLPALPTEDDLKNYAVSLTEAAQTKILTHLIATANIQFLEEGDQYIGIALRDIEPNETLGFDYFDTEYFEFAEYAGRNYQPRLFYLEGGDVIPYALYEVNRPRVIIPHQADMNKCIEAHVPRENMPLYDAQGEHRLIQCEIEKNRIKKSITPFDSKKTDVHVMDVHFKTLQKDMHNPTHVTALIDFSSALVGEHQPHAFLVGIKPMGERDKEIKFGMSDIAKYFSNVGVGLNALCGLSGIRAQWRYTEEEAAFLLETTYLSEEECKRIQKILIPFKASDIQSGEKYFFKIPYAMSSNAHLTHVFRTQEKAQATQRALREKYLSEAPLHLNTLCGLQSTGGKWRHSKQQDAFVLEITHLRQGQQKNIQRIVQTFGVIRASGGGRCFFKMPYATYVAVREKIEELSCPKVQQAMRIMRYGIFSGPEITRLISEYASEASPSEDTLSPALTYAH